MSLVAPDAVLRIDTVVVGAGAAGLAAGWHLRAAGREFVIVDAGARIGDSWRERYDCLRLFTPARYCELPGRPMALPPLAHPDKDEVARYLTDYASTFDLPVRAGHVVTGHQVRDDRHRLDLDHRRRGGSDGTGGGIGHPVEPGEVGQAGGIEAEHVIVATGAFRRPAIPGLAAALDPSIRQLHSSRYRRPADLVPGPVLVVGAGTAGADIALDVAGHHETWLSGPRTGHVPLAVVRSATVRSLYGLRVPGQLVRRRLAGRGSPLAWQTGGDLTAAGIRRVPRTVSARDGYPVLADGRVLAVTNVVWCTGFRPDYGWLEPSAIGADGWPAHRHGISTAVPGLGFVGLPFQHTFSSGFLGGMGSDAAYVVGRQRRPRGQPVSDAAARPRPGGG